MVVLKLSTPSYTASNLRNSVTQFQGSRAILKSLILLITEPWDTDFFHVTHTHRDSFEEVQGRAFFHITAFSTS